jgi:hypothetical protein
MEAFAEVHVLLLFTALRVGRFSPAKKGLELQVQRWFC